MSMPMTEVAALSLSDASRLVASRQVSPLELTEACIARAEAFDPKLNAFITRTFDSARVEAKTATAEIAAGKPRGPLHGIPFALKDLYETAGVRTTGASPFLENHVPAEDAAVVTRLKDAGVVMLGKLNLHEWALGGTNINYFFPTTHNPWNLDRITGGSSGGSAAALAAGLCLGSLGSDTRGSIRIPASLCGITGLKGTYGRVSLRGVLQLCWSLDHAGPMGRSAEDCALILNAIAGYDASDPTSAQVPVPDYSAYLQPDLNGIRIGVPRNFFFDPEAVDADVATAVQATRDVFTGLGAQVVDVDFPDVDRLLDGGVFLADAAAYHKQRLGEAPEKFSEAIRNRLLDAQKITAADYSLARMRQLELKQGLATLFQDVDLILTPTTPLTAIPIADGDAWPARRAQLLLRNTSPYNTAGVPVISVPCGFSSEGLPIGLSLAGAAWQEGPVLRAAYAYQQVTDWHKRRPPLG